jgi:rare lipoprotein A (peptidoglycan hydrolase)
MKKAGKVISVLMMMVLVFFPVSITAGMKTKKLKKVKPKKAKKKMTLKELIERLNNHRAMEKRHWTAMMQSLKKLSKIKLNLRQAQSKEHYQELNSLIRKLKNSVKVHRHGYAFHSSQAKKLSAMIPKPKAKAVMTGEASFYDDATCNYGNSITAAMRGFRGNRVKVTNLDNNRSVSVEINDYGPAGWTGRVIDLSRASFERIAPLSQGVISRVKVEVY